jgi:hypothetical protein
MVVLVELEVLPLTELLVEIQFFLLLQALAEVAVVVTNALAQMVVLVEAVAEAVHLELTSQGKETMVEITQVQTTVQVEAVQVLLET